MDYGCVAVLEGARVVEDNNVGEEHGGGGGGVVGGVGGDVAPFDEVVGG